jgi:6-phosphogluconate dehydrogenase (decarboxylating)
MEEQTVQIGVIGLGRMGANIAQRLLSGGHQCVVFDMSPKAVTALTGKKAVGSSSLGDLVKIDCEPGSWGPRAVDQRVSPVGGWHNPMVAR